MAKTPRLRRLHAYRLSGMTRRMWQSPHPRWGRPAALVGIFIGTWKASRTWYGFEVRVGGKEQGCIFMPQEDLDQLTVEDLGPYGGPKE